MKIHCGFPHLTQSLLFYALVSLPVTLFSQTINIFNVSNSAGAFTEFYGGDAVIDSRDAWSGSFNLGVSGVTNGSSSLSNPGLGSSGSSSFSADLNYNALSWDLQGSATTSINTGLGNLGSSFPTILSSSGNGALISFSIDTPFTINLSSSLASQFNGLELGDLDKGRATTRLKALVIDGLIVDQYLAEWDTFNGSTGGSYAGSFNQAVLRLEFGAGADLSSNIPGAFGTQFSSYDLQLSVQPIPEPSGALLALLGGGWLLGLRRRRASRPSFPAS